MENFDRIRVGNLVVVRYLEAVTLELKKLVAVGDQVEATYTETVAISFEPAGEPQ